ncbi:hypothetical protein [Proteiniborus sp. MB09-C3]|uniref:hypothetical protein n=1 Tax=Proteiniborus sp. MB09-C3 TaxID=3050072 RepID=UPI0025566EB9|nr:hypothetical protein [Proteiniborus sp. MB09-C3]WIV13221.1 hypothetical protein QO263_05795 [Proteiniborus sp. MB09-C3]
MNGNLFICGDNQAPEAVIPLKYDIEKELNDLVVSFNCNELKEDFNINIDEKTMANMTGHNFKVDNILYLASFETNEGTKYLDLKTGKLRDISDVELVISDLRPYGCTGEDLYNLAKASDILRYAAMLI